MISRQNSACVRARFTWTLLCLCFFDDAADGEDADDVVVLLEMSASSMSHMPRFAATTLGTQSSAPNAADDDGAAILADFSKASSYYRARNDTVDAFAVRCGGPKAVVSSPNRVSDVTRTRLTA